MDDQGDTSMRRIRRPQLVLDLKDDTACNQFRARLAAMECPEEGIQRAWQVLRTDQFGEYNITTRSLTTPQFAYEFKAMLCKANAEPVPRRQFQSLNPGEIAVEFEHRRLEPNKVNIWFRSGPALTQPDTPVDKE